MQVETFADGFDNQFSKTNREVNENGILHTGTLEKGSRKKPAKLDLSMLFPKSLRHGGARSLEVDQLTRSPSSGKDADRWNLRRALSRESIRSQKNSSHSEQPAVDHALQQRISHGSLSQLYEHYEQMSFRSPYMDQILESRIPNEIEIGAEKDCDHTMSESTATFVGNQAQHQSPSLEKEPFSWNNAQNSVASRPWESSSAASVSSRNSRNSRNTKNSKHTHSSALSNSDLKEKSVLSLSSDSEGDDSGEELMRSPSKEMTKNFQNEKALRVLTGGSAESITETTRSSSEKPTGSIAKKQIRLTSASFCAATALAS